MTRKGVVFIHNKRAGVLRELENGGYQFSYDQDYLKDPNHKPASLTLPLTSKPYISKTLFAFFDGLIPEGWLLNHTLEYWKLKNHDRMGLLLKTCSDCIGSVHIEEVGRD